MLDPKASKKNICLFGFAKWYNTPPKLKQQASPIKSRSQATNRIARQYIVVSV
jgi:hypothetical protein